MIPGAIFTEDQKDSSTELAFKYAVYKINRDKTLLPYTSLVYDIQYVPRDDSFHASKKGINYLVAGLIKLRELVRSPHNGDLEIHLRQADPESYRAVLKEIKSKEIHNIVIDTKPSNMQHFLKGILQLQMNDYKYHYLFTTFDIETFDLEDFKYNFVNMTAFRVVDIEDTSVKEVLRDMVKFQSNREVHPINSSYIQVISENQSEEYFQTLIHSTKFLSLGTKLSANVSDSKLPPVPISHIPEACMCSPHSVKAFYFICLEM
ncbi:hypothetical protein NQ315_000757 [Exocentrus adspersus]|uniref:Receptor ligand binding region domain-containing protein n=1 Tax=Exocentrus adspersus TaxID=1586481 RepID=A0AAV8WEG1_9CUCU|nr:hypothetical protein NQ315_000757 [Exocentrus adspersus]